MQIWKVTTFLVAVIAMTMPTVEAGHTVTYEDSGIACGVGAVVITVAVCSLAGTDSSFLHDWPLESSGLESVTVTVAWEPESPLSETLLLTLDIPGGPGISTSGTSPLVLHAEDLTVSGDLRTRVFADYMGGVALQQAFAITLDVVYTD